METRAVKNPRTKLGYLFLLLVAACGTEVDPSSEAGPLPDVVIVLIDTLRADFVDLEGESASPFLASLARESVVFEDASSAAPWTLPSIASLVSGRHVAEHGVVMETRKLSGGVKTLAERLRERGYATRAVYKNPYAGPMADLDRGYSHSVQTSHEVGGEAAARLLVEAGGIEDGQPIFLYVHNAAPHDPPHAASNNVQSLTPEEREFIIWYRDQTKLYRELTRRSTHYENRDGDRDFDAEQTELVEKLTMRQAEAYRIYARTVKESDERIESIVAMLRERGRWDQTLFIVLSDHGEEMGEHGGWQHDQSLYQELVHVPLIIRFPGGKFGGTRIQEPATLIDLIPTVFGGLGLPEAADDLSGQDWWEVLTGEADAPSGPRVISMRVNEWKRYGPWELERGDRNVAVREGKWKGIWNADVDTLELYDLELDPDELVDASKDEPEQAEQLRQVARETWARLKARSRVEQGLGIEGLDEEARKNLEALGYLGGEDD